MKKQYEETGFASDLFAEPETITEQATPTHDPMKGESTMNETTKTAEIQQEAETTAPATVKKAYTAEEIQTATGFQPEQVKITAHTWNFPYSGTKSTVFRAAFVSGMSYRIPSNYLKSASAEVVFTVLSNSGKSMKVDIFEKYNGEIKTESSKRKPVCPGSHGIWCSYDPETNKFSGSQSKYPVEFIQIDTIDLANVSRWTCGRVYCVECVPMTASELETWKQNTGTKAVKALTENKESAESEQAKKECAAMREKFINDGWENPEFEKVGENLFRMLSTGNVYKSNGEVYYYNVKTVSENKEESAQPETAAEQAEPEETAAEPEKQEEPETSKPKKTGKKSKKQEKVKELTAEEWEKMKISGEWRSVALLMLKENRNPDLIMSAGIYAGIITAEEFDDYLKNGIMPHYHTYAEWKKMGRQVKTGEHAKFKARIWKYTELKASAECVEMLVNAGDNPQDAETLESRFIKKESFFFGLDQTEEAGKITKFEIGKTYETRAGRITVTDRTETELTFTAAVNGKSYTKDIQQGKKCEFVKINKAGMTAQATAEVKMADTAPETKPAETVPEQQDQPEQTTEKFVAGLVYWDKLQIISRTDKTVTVKNILTGETFRKKINVGKPDKRKPTEAEYIKINDYSKLWATCSGCTIKESAERGIASSTKDVERAKKEEYRFRWDGFAKGRYDDAVKRLEAYKRILKEQEAA